MPNKVAQFVLFKVEGSFFYFLPLLFLKLPLPLLPSLSLFSPLSISFPHSHTHTLSLSHTHLHTRTYCLSLSLSLTHTHILSISLSLYLLLSRLFFMCLSMCADVRVSVPLTISTMTISKPFSKKKYLVYLKQLFLFRFLRVKLKIYEIFLSQT